MTHARHAFGPLVRALREARGMTLMQLARESGLSAGYISRVERQDERTASTTATLALASALHVDPRELTGQLPPYRALRKTILPREPRERIALMLGITEEHLIIIENGTEPAPDDFVERLSIMLGVPMMVLTGDSS